MQINVYISNISEDVWSFIDSMHDKEKRPEVDENAYLSDRELLTMPAEEKNVAILPVSCNQDFLAYYQDLFNVTDLEILIPDIHTGEICKDIKNDSLLLERLIELGKNNTLSFTSYSASFQFYELISHLKSLGISIETPESPTEKDAWVVNYFGSKSGIRQTADQMQSIEKPWMGKGYIAQGVGDVAAIAANVFCRDKAVVLKTNKAHAGAGVKIFRESDLPTEYVECRKALEEFLRQEAYWQLFPTVIEAGLDIDSDIGGGNPNCEFLITPEREVNLLYICGMRVSKEGVFKGVEIQRDVLPKEIVGQLLHFGEALGKEYADAGYRGYFDVDCLYTKTGKLFITESNVRRTGATHVYHAAERLIGPNYMDEAYILSNNSHSTSASRSFNFLELYKKLVSILYSKETKEGLVFASVNGLKDNLFGYIIFGRNKERAHEIEEEMERLLKEYS